MDSRLVIDQVFEEALPRGVKVSYHYGRDTPVYYATCERCDRPFGQFTSLDQVPYQRICKHCQFADFERTKKFLRTGNVNLLKPKKTRMEKAKQVK